MVSSAYRARTWFILAFIVLAILTLASLWLGTRFIAPGTVWQALVTPVSGNPDHLVVRELRVPRTLIGITAGAALGATGILIQGITRNPIADAGILGLSSGSSLAVVVGLSSFAVTAPLTTALFALAGAAIASVIVFSIANFGSTQTARLQPARLALIGAAFTAITTPLISLLLIRDINAFDSFRFWTLGSLTGRGIDTFAVLWPLIVVGLIVALPIGSRLNLLALGDDTAVSLGQRLSITRTLTLVSLVLLCGTATALAGPMALTGLIVAHASRKLMGNDYRRTIPFSMLLGPILVLVADILGRFAFTNSELEAGIVIAVIGAPVLIVVARSRKMSGL